MMAGERNLSVLLKSLNPEINPGKYVFCSVRDRAIVEGINYISCFYEEEGMTYILSKEIADKYNLEYEGYFSWITLKVQSSLQAVGLTAAVSKVLAENNISCNVVSAFFHDHLFVEFEKRRQALSCLKTLSG